MSERVTGQGRNQVLLVKMTPGEQVEAQGLADGSGKPNGPGRKLVVSARTSAGQAGRRDVLVVWDARTADQIQLGRQRFDLTQAGGRAAFVEALGLSPERGRRVCEALAYAAPDARDELAQIARVMHWAEQGKVTPRRLVLSGHYHHGGIRGNEQGFPNERAPHNGALTMASLKAVASAFPKAAERIEHLMIASCFRANHSPADTLSPTVLDSYRAMFPRLKSVTSYSDRAPRAGQGAERDLQRWAAATARGESPSRDRVFGQCRPEAGAPSLAHKRSHGVVFTDRGAERCPTAR